VTIDVYYRSPEGIVLRAGYHSHSRVYATSALFQLQSDALWDRRKFEPRNFDFGAPAAYLLQRNRAMVAQLADDLTAKPFVLVEDVSIRYVLATSASAFADQIRRAGALSARGAARIP
jgi:hypothetical protein